MKLKEKLVILGLLALAGLFALAGPAVASPQLHQLGCKPSSQTTLSNHYNARLISGISQTTSSSAAVDWAAGMPSPGDQGQQGSCVAWSTGYNYKSYQEQQERNWGLATNSHLFSPAYIYNQIDGGVDGGASIADAMNLLVNQGDDTLDDFPYNDQNCTTQPTQAQRQRAAQYKELSWTPIFQGTANITAMKSALANGPIEAGTDVYWNAGWQTTGNISQSGVSGSSAGGHAIAIVGYDDSHQTNDGAGAFKFINSWGTSWGNYGGYGWISYKYAQNNFFEAEVMYDQAPNNNTFSVSGNISDQNQQPVSGVAMNFTIVSGSGTLPTAVTTNTSGNWTQSGFQAGTTYRVTPSKASYTFTPASQDFDGTQATVFNFTASAPAPVSATISVTAPAGGANWQTGSSHTISWSYTGNPGSAVKLDLLKGGSLSSTIIASTSAGSNGSGSYSWLAPASLAAGS
ncbi:MAG: C1 family peptidase, partial [Thermacetogeniaceae bacterium]